jgi:hypothetical protein
MKYIIYSALFLTMCVISKAQTTQLREVKTFNKIVVGGAATIYFTQSDTFSVKVIANELEINNINTTVTDSVLYVKAKGIFKQDYRVYIKANNINQLTASGVSKIISTNSINSDSLSLDASGASEMDLIVASKKIDILLTGASQISISGNTQSLQSNLNGASTLKAYKLNSKNTSVKASGASNAKVFANEKINANATGASSVKFKGEPKEVSAEASSSSSITKVVGDEVSKNSDKKDSTTINFRKKKFVIINKENDSDSNIGLSREDRFHHWSGFAMGVNGFLSNGSTTLPKSQDYMSLNYGKSLNFQLNPFEKDIHIYKDYINLVIGLGFEWNQYEFSNKTKLNADSSYTSGKIDSSNSYVYKKNRLKSTFVNVPILLEFNTNKNPDKAFHLALGVIAGYKLGSRTRQILEKDGNDIRFIRKDDYNINPFRINAHASVGFKNFTVFGNYALTPLFVKGKGPELYPFTIGLKIVTF